MRKKVKKERLNKTDKQVKILVFFPTTLIPIETGLIQLPAHFSFMIMVFNIV